ncbi:DNA repair protein RAD16 [Naganishia albida]|nr:DNA repair protein RAD16 [Naganishia albida]
MDDDTASTFGGDQTTVSGLVRARKHNPLLRFHKSIIRDIAGPEEDDLLVLAKGLGMRRIICNLMKLYDGERNLVLLVNASTNDETGLGEELSTMGVRKPGLRVVGHEMQSKARKSLYESGGLISVTSRILIVDMLTNNIPTDLITGMIVLHAERVTANSIETFIIRLYRQKNLNGFLKAFSDEPESFTFGISPLQNTMKNLCLRKVHLWPRFHEKVHESLGQRRADVIELYQPLSPLMSSIQGAIIECMEATLAELRRSNTTLDIDDFTVENALFRNFDKIVRSQLDPVWHRVGPKTRKLVGDLQELRRLLTYLLSYDSVTYNSYLETIIASNSTTQGAAKQNQSPWLYLDAANTLFQSAKKRAYITISKDKPWPTSAPTDDNEEDWAALRDAESDHNGYPIIQKKKQKWPAGVQPVLEELPKWKLLGDVLEEIETEIAYGPEIDLTSTASNAVLVLCNSERTCSQLREYLSTMQPFTPGQHNETEGAGRTMMERLLRTYFYWKNGLRDISQTFKRNLTADKEDQLNVVGQEGPTANGRTGQPGYRRGGVPPNKRRRTRAGSTSASSSRSQKKEDRAIAGQEDLENEVIEISDFTRSSLTSTNDFLEDSGERIDGHGLSLDPTQTLLAPSAQETLTDAFNDQDYDEFYGLLEPEEVVIVRPYGGDDDELVLAELRPRFVVMYDPDPAFVRRIEVYKCSNPGLGVRVYFMMYSDSVEEQRYLSGLRREKNAFERLIREKSNMIIPMTEHPRAPHHIESRARSITSISSRNAGGATNIEPARVIVDMREFRSNLPSLLHAADMLVIPATLTVGDYIITPTMCVERKSVPDLIQSFNSGRLFTQCEQMTMHYGQPILLIEFEENKSFQLQTIVEQRSITKDKKAPLPGPTGIDPTTVQSKLVLLTLAFPRLRIIWSSSTQATVDIIADLKMNHPEPDLLKAITIGGDEDGESGAGGEGSGLYNTTSQEMLRAMPGITSGNWKLVSSRVDSIRDLCDVESEDAMKEVIGGQEQGKACWDFINKDAR